MVDFVPKLIGGVIGIAVAWGLHIRTSQNAGPVIAVSLVCTVVASLLIQLRFLKDYPDTNPWLWIHATRWVVAGLIFGVHMDWVHS